MFASARLRIKWRSCYLEWDGVSIVRCLNPVLKNEGGCRFVCVFVIDAGFCWKYNALFTLNRKMLDGAYADVCGNSNRW